jgi:hypothetical protein
MFIPQGQTKPATARFHPARYATQIKLSLSDKRARGKPLVFVWTAGLKKICAGQVKKDDI